MLWDGEEIIVTASDRSYAWDSYWHNAIQIVVVNLVGSASLEGVSVGEFRFDSQASAGCLSVPRVSKIQNTDAVASPNNPPSGPSNHTPTSETIAPARQIAAGDKTSDIGFWNRDV
jgi:hypothetical protein